MALTKTDNANTTSVDMLGDTNGEDIVNIFCVTIALACRFKTKPSKWNPNTDITNKNLIDIFNLVIAALNFGETNP
jgi:hypothetical protein